MPFLSWKYRKMYGGLAMNRRSYYAGRAFYPSWGSASARKKLTFTKPPATYGKPRASSGRALSRWKVALKYAMAKGRRSILSRQRLRNALSKMSKSRAYKRIKRNRSGFY